jgi:predicted transcriptional regulator
VIPALQQAAVDPTLGGHDLEVLTVVEPELSSSEFRLVKHDWLARVQGVSLSTISRSMGRLVRRDYLSRRRTGRVYEYRLGDRCTIARFRQAG